MRDSSDSGIRLCESCGEPVTHSSRGVRARYCCRACWPVEMLEHFRAIETRHDDKRRGRSNRSTKVVRCVWCHGEFNPKRGKVAKPWCSTECWRASAHGPSLREVPKIREPRKFSCVGCGVTISNARKWCSERCRRLHHSNNFSTDICYLNCLECNRLFVSPVYSGAKFCSQRCAKKTRRRKRRHHQTLPGAENIGIFVLGDRDGWICHLCGKKVPRRKYRGSAMCPTIDHLVPVSAGGSHTWDNVALAHNKCNYERSDTGEAQLRLLG